MKATGIVRRIDDLGRVVIPKKSAAPFVSAKATLTLQHLYGQKTTFPQCSI